MCEGRKTEGERSRKEERESESFKCDGEDELGKEDNDGLLTLPLFLKSDHYYDLIKRVRIKKRKRG